MPTFGDETLHDRYEREHADHMARLAKMTPEQIADLELSLHNALAEVDRLRTQAQAAPEAEPVVDVSGIGRDADHPRAVVLYLRTEPSDDDMRAIQNALRTAPQHDAELVNLLRDQMTWHEARDKELSKSGRSDADYHWRRLQHQEQIALIDAKLAALRGPAHDE